MANIDRIVTVNISLQTAGITQEGFSTIMVVGPHVHALPRSLTYTSPDDMLADGFSNNDPLYLALNAGFGQTPKPTQIKVGRRQVDVVKIEAKAATAATVYKVDISKKVVDGSVVTETYEFTADAEPTLAEIATGLQALVTADADAPVNATVASNQLVLTAKVPSTAFAIKLSTNLVLKEALPVADIEEDLSAIVAEDNDWYGLAITSRTQADILAVAEWAEARKKLFGTAIAEPGAKDAASTTDTLAKLMEGNYFRSHGWYHKDAATDFLDVAVMADAFSSEPGMETWANQRLGGITTDKLSETEAQAVFSKNGNTFEAFRNITITQNGRVAGGEWIDIIRFRDWLEEEIKVRVFQRMVDTKIRFTDGGIAIIQQKIKGALALADRRGALAETEYDEEGNAIPGYTIKVPLSYNISTNDKANRILRDVYFSARPSGAIHATVINGKLTYEM